MSDKLNVLQTALAALLHDVGKFAQRAGVPLSTPFNAALKQEVRYVHALLSDQFVTTLVPAPLGANLTAPRRHHNPQSRQDRIVALANEFASGERWLSDEPIPPLETIADAVLVPVFDQVSLVHAANTRFGAYALDSLSAAGDMVFPRETVPDQRERYRKQWADFQRDAALLGRQNPTLPAYLTSMAALLRQYTSLMPLATPRMASAPPHERPDISLYDHSRITAALAAILEMSADDAALTRLEQATRSSNSTAVTLPVARLYRGDFSGIQAFIYRITRFEDDRSFDNVSKGLRGRSFYVTILGELIAQWFVRQLGLPGVNVLFVGGGRFDLLVPATDEIAKQLKTIEQHLNDWMREEFWGEFSLRSAQALLKAADLADMSKAYEALDTALEQGKHQKWRGALNNADFMTPQAAEYAACRMSSLPLHAHEQARGISDQCLHQIDIGRCLPRTDYLAFVWDTAAPLGQTLAHETEVHFGGPLQASVCLLAESRRRGWEPQLRSLAQHMDVELCALNHTHVADYAIPGIGSSFRFLANTAPIARQLIDLPEESVHPREVLHFGAIAELSTGSELIGVLKADVDRLGLVFGMGLTNSSGTKPTISRLATLSSQLDLFFCGWLNTLCQQIFDEWQQVTNDPRVDNLLYVMYAGGDDLFVIGPWDQIVVFAQRLQKAFVEFTHHNPNLTLSAGIVAVKPKYPVQRFAALAHEALEAAKGAGRDRVTLFGQTLTWDAFGRAMQFAHEMHAAVQNGDMPRTLVHDLGRIYRQHAGNGAGMKPMWTPRLYYTLVRRLKPAVLEQFKEQIVALMPDGAILVPMSYVSLITRN